MLEKVLGLVQDAVELSFHPVLDEIGLAKWMELALPLQEASEDPFNGGRDRIGRHGVSVLKEHPDSGAQLALDHVELCQSLRLGSAHREPPSSPSSWPSTQALKSRSTWSRASAGIPAVRRPKYFHAGVFGSDPGGTYHSSASTPLAPFAVTTV